MAIDVYMYDYEQSCTTSTIQEGVLQHPHSHFFLQSSLQVCENPLNPTNILLFCLLTVWWAQTWYDSSQGKWTCKGSSYSIKEEHLCCWFIMCVFHISFMSLSRILVDEYTGREANIHIQWSWRYEIYFFVFLKNNELKDEGSC